MGGGVVEDGIRLRAKDFRHVQNLGWRSWRSWRQETQLREFSASSNMVEVYCHRT